MYFHEFGPLRRSITAVAGGVKAEKPRYAVEKWCFQKRRLFKRNSVSSCENNEAPVLRVSVYSNTPVLRCAVFVMVELNSRLVLTPQTQRSDPPLRVKARRVWIRARIQLLLEHAGRFHQSQTEEKFFRGKKRVEEGK